MFYFCLLRAFPPTSSAFFLIRCHKSLVRNKKKIYIYIFIITSQMYFIVYSLVTPASKYLWGHISSICWQTIWFILCYISHYIIISCL